MIIAQIIFNVGLFIVWPLHFIYSEFLIGSRRRSKRNIKALLAQINHRWRWDRDLLGEQQRQQLQRLKTRGEALEVGDPDPEAVDEFFASVVRQLSDMKSPKKGRAAVKEWLELIIVVFGVVMGARALFLQPFKIPTGSMQPTLSGINFVPQDLHETPNFFKKIFLYTNYSRRYANAVIEEDGVLTVDQLGRSPSITRKNRFLFFPVTEIKIGSKRYKLPGEPAKVLRYIQLQRILSYPDRAFEVSEQGQRVFYFRQGDILSQGYLELGDHLFVDRVGLNFFEPSRGDITVFTTENIRTRSGKSLRGRFFIKRLVGLPGDELKIADKKLYVRKPGDSSFTLVDGTIRKAFDRIYSFKGGYRGYSHHPHCQFLKDNNDTFQVGEDEYFMLGDNSENSQDSRFWGVVPRRNLVGRAKFVYWPFSRRWGGVDSAEPLEFVSAPTF